MIDATLTVNGVRRGVRAHADTPLLWVIRDHLGLTGTKYGCGIGACGACTVHEGERAVRACQITLQEAQGRAFTTIEGLAEGESHPCQRAWIAEDVAQCGYCQPGMIMAAAALLAAHPRASDEEIDAALSEHVCRCGTYNRLRRAVHQAAALMAGGRS